MKRAATHLFKRQSENRAFFSKLTNFYFDLRSPGHTPGQDRGAKNPTPGATRMCGSPGGGELLDGMVRLGIDLC